MSASTVCRLYAVFFEKGKVVKFLRMIVTHVFLLRNVIKGREGSLSTVEKLKHASHTCIFKTKMLKYFHTFIASPPFYDVYGFDVCCRERGREEHRRPYSGLYRLTLFSFLGRLYSQKHAKYKTIVALFFFSFCFLFDFP